MSSKLIDLMEAVIDELTSQVKNGQVAIDAETGEVTKSSTPAAILNVARQLLKDLNIEPTKDNDRVQGLIASLPFDAPGDRTSH